MDYWVFVLSKEKKMRLETFDKNLKKIVYIFLSL